VKKISTGIINMQLYSLLTGTLSAQHKHIYK